MSALASSRSAPELCMVLCEKGCFNRYVRDPGSKVAYYVRIVEKLYGPVTSLASGTKNEIRGLNIFMVLFSRGVMCRFSRRVSG